MEAHTNSVVSEAYAVINSLPATIVQTKPLKTVDFAAYIAAFAGSNFLSPLPPTEIQPSNYDCQAASVHAVYADNYYQHFQDCLVKEYRAQLDQKASENMYGATIKLHNAQHSLYALEVPGLRNGNRQISLGDVVMLRQITIDPQTSLPRVAHTRSSDGSSETVDPRAGFNGLQHTAIVIKTLKAKNLLIRRISRLQLASSVFNVSFGLPFHHGKAHQRALTTVKHELDRLTQKTKPAKSNGTQQATSEPVPAGGRSQLSMIRYLEAATARFGLERSWLESMLFPSEADGAISTSPPKDVFTQS